MKLPRHRFRTMPALRAGVVAAIALLGCTLPRLASAAEAATYPSAQAAVDALVAAARANDKAALMNVLGDGASALLDSGDPVADATARARFVEQFDEANTLVADGENRYTLEVGSDGWPSPAPLVQQGEQWVFDTAAGADEMVFRRIGRNEIGAMETLLGIVEAQSQYASEGRDGLPAGVYAQRLISSPDRHDGLYWPTQPDEPASPVGPFLATAASEGYSAAGDNAGTYHGYRYRLLTSQGPAAPGGARNYLEGGLLKSGFAVVAYPAGYRASGVQTFLINHEGALYQQDLGENTAKAAIALESFNPDAGWSRVEPEPR